MALTKQQKIDQITVNENGIVLYREVTRILEDDNYKIVRSITILKGNIGKEFVKIEICEVIE